MKSKNGKLQLLAIGFTALGSTINLLFAIIKNKNVLLLLIPITLFAISIVFWGIYFYNEYFKKRGGQ